MALKGAVNFAALDRGASGENVSIRNHTGSAASKQISYYGNGI